MPSRVIYADSADKIPSAPVDGLPTLVYWATCNLAQPIRYALECVGVDFVDVRVHWGPAEPTAAEGMHTPGYKGMWKERKVELAKTQLFPNVPYFMEQHPTLGDVHLVQSTAILRFIGRKKPSLMGGTLAHMCDMVLDQAIDLDWAMMDVQYDDWASATRWCTEKLPDMLARWDRLLGEKKLMVSDDLTIADLKAYECFRKIKLMEADPAVATSTFASFPRLCGFVERVESEEPIKRYMSSPQYIARPLNTAHAQWK
uniref:glutathione transferase n=1 Tax=Oxyrrhis marina TaxID=2969 RepID=A0A7S3UME1_OXYMA